MRFAGSMSVMFGWWALNSVAAWLVVDSGIMLQTIPVASMRATISFRISASISNHPALQQYARDFDRQPKASALRQNGHGCGRIDIAEPCLAQRWSRGAV
jgi:hypothetical protein